MPPRLRARTRIQLIAIAVLAERAGFPSGVINVLGGVTRELVLRLARRAGLEVREEPVAAALLGRASEVLITASTIEVVPVVRLDDRPVGSGVPGPVARRLQVLYRREVERAMRRVRQP